MFAISHNTLNLWLEREQEIGDFRAIADYQKGKKTKRVLHAFSEPVLPILSYFLEVPDIKESHLLKPRLHDSQTTIFHMNDAIGYI